MSDIGGRMRAVLYCRVSSAEQVQNLSLSTQEEACREYCQRQGYEVERVFVDAGESARSTNRPAFLQLLEYCRQHQGQVHAVVIYALTRFSRNNADHHAIATLLRGLGVALRSVTEPIDESPSGRLMEGILASMAQFDNDVKSERVRAGLRSALERGRWVWVAPIGYLTGSARDGERSLRPDPDRAPLVRQAFEYVASGDYAGRRLRQKLTEIGLTNRRGAPISMTQLYVILRNPIYVGRIVPKRGPLGTIKGDFDPIVSEELFARVQARLAAKGTAIKAAMRHTNHPDFPLRRFVRCAQCGRPLTGAWSTGRSKKYAFYRCQKGCTSVRGERLHQEFIDLLEGLPAGELSLGDFRRELLQRSQQREHRARVERSRQQANANRIEAKLQRLDHVFIFEGRIDDKTYRAQRSLLREQLTGAQQQPPAGEEADDQALRAFAHEPRASVSALWQSLSRIESRQRLQVALFPAGLRWERSGTLIASVVTVGD